MPSRMIRDGYLDSEAYASVDDLAKLVWHHMLSVADDFGCLSLAPTFVRRRLFYNQPSDATVSRVLSQLYDADLIRIYTHDDSRYAFIPRFRQRLQRSTLKHPIPPNEILQNDPDALEKFKKIREGTEKTPVPHPVHNGSTAVPQPPEEKRREEKIEASARVARGTRLQADWEPSSLDLTFLQSQRPDLNSAEVIAKFRDYWTAVPGQRGTKLDWSATFRNFIRSERRGPAPSRRGVAI